MGESFDHVCIGDASYREQFITADFDNKRSPAPEWERVETITILQGVGPSLAHLFGLSIRLQWSIMCL
ncbi:hypothetical protein AALP_AA5G049200 [Arabis alpina]|uniref:Uncharacterized protein n=1 Tax=Arabis alpina TaxID=50452 RepID=A0A087GV00_ARAAL|nr:hypothetical protein AALP_AA5G049200 [Arabis alpina]